jgi:serine/threonine protein kinase
MIDDSTTLDPPSNPDDDAFADDPRVAELADAYLRELESGNSPDRRDYLERFPELAPAIAQCLEGLELVRSGRYRADPSLSDSGKRESLPASVSLTEPLGDFKLLRELDRGGMGIVYEAIQLSLGRRVAVKVLPFAATFNSRQLQRFKLEAQTAALLHHTHIVPVYAVGCERGVHFYAMQLIEGQSLAVVIRQLREKDARPVMLGTASSQCKNPARQHNTEDWHANELPTPKASQPLIATDSTTFDVSAAMTAGASLQSEAYVRRIARLMVQAADALEHAHQGGVVHRDIKPANLLVDTSSNLWITDFGLAQLQTDQGLTHTGDFLGTFRYMSPEQASGQRAVLDHRTDIYSLGATFYELLALEPAFLGHTHQELLYKILHQEPQSIRQWNRGVPQELETIILKALNKTIGDRYRTAADFRDDIQRYLDHQPIHAKRPSLFDRLRKWSRRHPSMIVAGFLLLSVVAVASLIGNRLVSQEQRRTAEALDREKLRAREAELRFQQAKQAVDALFQISEEELADKPMEGARKRILEVVLSHYQDFIEQRAGDPVSQAELTSAQAKVRNILRELNVMQRQMHLRLLGNPAVHRELHLTSDQQAALAKMVDDWSDERQSQFDELRSLPEGDRRRGIVALAEKHESALARLLAADQLQRFKQISIQAQGLFAFKEPEIVRTLALTNEQRTMIRDIERNIFMRRFVSGPDHGPPPRPESFDRDQEQALAQVLAILTHEQLHQWQELVGKPFSDFGEERLPGLFLGPPRRIHESHR